MMKSDNEFTVTSDLKDESDTGHLRLKQAIRQAKSAQADRLDSISDLQETDIARLELLAQELQPVFDDVPAEDEQWDFCLSRGMQPRLWLDASAFVMIARDRRNYRFVRDTRLGRIVLAESTEIIMIATAVTRYIALRILERERLMDTLSNDFSQAELSKNQDKPAYIQQPQQTATDGATLLNSVLWFAGGALLGCLLLVIVFHHYGIRLPMMN